MIDAEDIESGLYDLLLLFRGRFNDQLSESAGPEHPANPLSHIMTYKMDGRPELGTQYGLVMCLEDGQEFAIDIRPIGRRVLS